MGLCFRLPGILAVGRTAKDLLKRTTADDMGHAAIFELAQAHGGTHPWELLQWMLSDSCKAEGQSRLLVNKH